MKQIVLNTSGMDFSGYYPHQLCERIKANELITFALTEDDDSKMYAVASFTLITGNRAAILEYIYVGHDFRQTGLAGELLEFAGRKLADAKIRLVYSKIIGTPKWIDGMFRLFTEAEFIPLTLLGHYLEYDIDSLLENENVLKLAGQKASRNIISLKDEEDYLYKIARLTLGSMGSRLESKDMNYSRFCFEKNRLIGCALFVKVSDSLIYMSDLYLAPECKQEELAYPLCFGFINSVSEDMSENIKCTFNIGQERIYRVLLKMLGKPNCDYITQEFCKRLY